MSATHEAVILCMRIGPAYKEESMKMDYPDMREMTLWHIVAIHRTRRLS